MNKERVVTIADVVEKREETQALYSSLMDRMETSIDKCGQYFVKFGSKKPIDTRALLFIESLLDKKEMNHIDYIFIAITRLGPQKIVVPREKMPQVDNAIKKELKKTTAEEDAEEDNESSYAHQGFLHNSFLKYYIGMDTPNISISNEKPTIEEVESVLEKSKAKAIFPNKEKLKKAEKRLEEAKQIAGIITSSL